MPTYGYYFSHEAWLGKYPASVNNENTLTPHPEHFNIDLLSDEVHREVLQNDVTIIYHCDGLIFFQLDNYLSLQNNLYKKLLLKYQLIGIKQVRLSMLKQATIVEIFNVHSFALRSSISAQQQINVHGINLTPHNIFVKADDLSQRDGIGAGANPDLNRYLARHGSTYAPGLPPSFDFRNIGKIICVADFALKSAALQLDRVIDRKLDGALKLVSLLNDAAYSLESSNYSRSLIDSWAVVEAILNRKWRCYIAQRRSGEVLSLGIGKERFKKLTGRDYTMSVITEILSFTNNLSHKEYTEIDKARRFRNKWMHTLEEIGYDTSMESFILAQSMLNKEFDFHFAVTPAMSGIVI